MWKHKSWEGVSMDGLVEELGSSSEDIPANIEEHFLQVFSKLGLSLELQVTLQTILDQLEYLVSNTACALLLLKEDQPTEAALYVAASKGFPDPALIEREVYKLKDHPLLAETLAVGKPAIAPPGRMASALFNQLPQSTEQGTSLHAPLIHQDRTIGLIVLYKQGAYKLTERDLLASMAFANQAALAIENARLYSETRQRAKQLEVTSQVSQKMISILDLDKLLIEVARLLQSIFGYYHVHIFLTDEHTNEIVLQEISGEAGESLRKQGLRIKIGGRGITAWVAENGQPLLCNDVSQESRYHPHILLPHTRSEVAVPMRIGSIVVGVLDVQSEQLNAFREDDVMAFQILADQIAIAIVNAHLFEETLAKIEFLGGLHQISLEIVSQLETEKVLDSILNQASHLLHAQGSVVAIHIPEEEVVRIIAEHNVSPDVIGVNMVIGEGVAGQVIAKQKPILVNDYRAWQNRSLQFEGISYNVVMGAPLRWQNKVTGVLVLLDDDERRTFSDDDAHLLMLFADLASIAFKNAELFEVVREAHGKMEQKVERRTRELSKAKQTLARQAERLRDLLRVTMNVQEEERTRIALDLHDGSNQLITGALYEIQAAQESIRGERVEQSLEKLEAAKRLLRTIEAENRRIITGLRPPRLDSEGLVAALRWYGEDFQEQYAIRSQIQVTGTPVSLDPDVEMAIYRIVQESLNNVAEHSKASRVQIQIRYRPLKLYITITDNGIGFDPSIETPGSANRVGLIGMRERAESVGGRLIAESTPGLGTHIRLIIPLRSQTRTEKSREY